jgi:siroheme synthase
VRRITCRLLEQGLSFNTPAAVIANATLPEQRSVVGTLGTITALVAEAELTAPATLVVGDVVRSMNEPGHPGRNERSHTMARSRREAT